MRSQRRQEVNDRVERSCAELKMLSDPDLTELDGELPRVRVSGAV
jgi:hypothetical protein